MSNSTHKVEVVRIDKVEPHPNADRLEIVKVFSGYQVVVGKGNFAPGSKAAYVPPDSLVPTDREEFAFLKDRPESPKLIDGRAYHRVKPVKLRGQFSMGMLVPISHETTEQTPTHVGADLASHYGVTHYVPPTRSENNTSKPATYGSRAEAAPEKDFGTPPSYDLEALRRYGDVFQTGEQVVVTEKIHGANGRYTFGERGWYSFSLGYRGQFSLRIGRFEVSRSKVAGLKFKRIDPLMLELRVGSRNQWKRPDTNDMWWRVALKYPEIAALCKAHPGKVLYGEVFGDVQDLTYGHALGEVSFIAFDVLDENGAWLNYHAFTALCDRYRVPTVPVVFAGAYDLDKIIALSEGKSLITPTQVREGVVVKPLVERSHPNLGRVALKVVGNGYLERAA